MWSCRHALESIQLAVNDVLRLVGCGLCLTEALLGTPLRCDAGVMLSDVLPATALSASVSMGRKVAGLRSD
eukprot:350389-Amphidinium_carterae.2